MVEQEHEQGQYSSDVVEESTEYDFPKISSLSEHLVVQANSIQEELLSRFGKYIPEKVIKDNSDLIDRISLIDDPDFVGQLNEWNVVDFQFEDGRTGFGFKKNDVGDDQLDINTGFIHIFDRSGIVTDDQEELAQDTDLYSQEEREYFDMMDLAYDIVLQYLDKSLPTSFRISATAFYAEMILKKLGVKPPFDVSRYKIHIDPAKLFAAVGMKYGDDLHKVAFGTFEGDLMRNRNIKRSAKTPVL